MVAGLSAVSCLTTVSEAVFCPVALALSLDYHGDSVRAEGCVGV